MKVDIICKSCLSPLSPPSIYRAGEWKKSYHCPVCGKAYGLSDITELILQEVQSFYVASNRDTLYLQEMYFILKRYARSIILNNFYSLTLTPDNLEVYSHTAASFIIEDYCRKPEYRIHSSFGKILYHKARQAIYEKKERMIEDISLDASLNEIGNLICDSDIVDDHVSKSEDKVHLQMIRDCILNIIFGFDQVCNTKFDNFIRLLVVRNKLKLGDRADIFFSTFGHRRGKDEVMETFNIIKWELQNSYKETM